MIGVLAPPRRRNRWFALGVGLGLVAPALALVALSAVSSRRASSLATERLAFATYEQAVERAVRDGGFVVTQGMRPGVADIAEGAYPDETLVSMASGWAGSMERVRLELSTADRPSFLVGVARRYDAALAAYVEVGEALVAAAEATGSERAARIAEVPPLGRQADELWNQAHAELERHRARLGIDEKG